MAGAAMAWTSKVKELFSGALAPMRRQDIEAFFAEAQQWKPRGFDLRMQHRLDYYLGTQKPQLVEALAAHFPETYREMQAVYINLVRGWVHETARVFRAPGKLDLYRDGAPIDAEDPSAQRWHRVCEGANGLGLHARLKRVERWMRLMNTATIEVSWDEQRGLPRLHLYPPHRVAVSLDPMEPGSIQAAHGVLLELAGESGLELSPGTDSYATSTTVLREMPSGQDAEVRLYRYYSARGEQPKAFAITSAGQLVAQPENPDNELPYRTVAGAPLLPLVAFFEHDEELGFFSELHADVFDFQTAYNVLLTDTHSIAEMQGFGELVLQTAQGAQPPGKIVRGPKRAMVLPEGITAQVLTYQPLLAEMQALAEQDAKRFLVANGIPPGRVAADSRQVASGDALDIEERSLMEEREDRIELMRPRLAELFEVIRAVNNYHTQSEADRIAEDLELRWTPGDVSRPRDGEKEVRVARARMDLGLSNPVEQIMEERGCSEEEAMAMHAKNLAMGADLMRARIGASLPAAQLAPLMREGADGETEEDGAEEPTHAKGNDGAEIARAPEEASAIFQYHINAGVVTVNEVRARLGLLPVPGGDRLIPPRQDGGQAPPASGEEQ